MAPILKIRMVVRDTGRSVVKVKRNSGTSERVRVRKIPQRNSKLWQSMLLLPLSLLPSLRHLPVDMLVPFLGAKSVTTTIIPAHVVNCRAPTVVKMGIRFDSAEHQPNQPIKLLEQVSVKPATVMVRSGITSETAPKQQQPTTPGEF